MMAEVYRVCVKEPAPSLCGEMLIPIWRSGPALRLTLGQVLFSGNVSGGRRQMSPGVNLHSLTSCQTHTHTMPGCFS